MSLSFDLQDIRRRNGQVFGTIRVFDDDRLVFADGVNLASARSRNQFFEGLAQRLGGTGPDQRLVDEKLLTLLQDAEAAFAAAGSVETSLDGDAEQGELSGPYRATPTGLLWLKPTQNGDVSTPLTNFTAQIIADILEDDGSGEPRRLFTLTALLGERHYRFDLLADRFHSMGWPAEQLGAQAILFPGISTRDHARTAIQLLSGAVPERRVYAHTGWVQVGGQWLYLHAAGPIGPVGPLPQVEVHLAAPLDRYVLPPPVLGDGPRRAIHASLAVLDVAPRGLTVPLLGSAYRAALGGADFALHLTGPTGEGKSELVALIQQHFGAGLDARHLPASWSSTENALEGLAFVAKDVVLVVDDFAPVGSQTDVAQLHRKADRVFRAQGNGSGRQRMRADTSLRAPRVPRGVILSTGEDLPRGQSLRGRLVVLEVAPGDVRWDALTTAQQQAAGGLYAQAMSGFIHWLAGQYDSIRAQLPIWEQERRNRALASGAHRRTPDNVAKLASGWTLFLQYAVAAGALTAAEGDALYERVWEALGQTAAAQAQHQQASDPVTRFFELLRAAISGGLANIASPENGAVQDGERQPASWGWEWRPAGEDGGYYVAKGMRVGWVDGDDLYLEPEVSYLVAQRIARDQGESLTVGGKTLHRRLAERGVLRSTEIGRGRLTIRRTFGGERQTVLHVSVSSLIPVETAQSSQSSQCAPEEAPAGVNEAVHAARSWADPAREGDGLAHERCGETAHDEARAGAAGTFGTIGPFVKIREAHDMESFSCSVCDATGWIVDTAGIPFCQAHAGGTRPDDGGETDPPGHDDDPGPGVEAMADAQQPQLIRDRDALVAVVPALLGAPLIGLDTETTGLDPHADRLRLIQLATPDAVFILDCFALDPRMLAPVFEKGRRFAGHNLRFDLGFLMANGLPIPDGERLFDTMLASQLVHSGLADPRGTHSLAGVVERVLGITLDKREQTSNWSGSLSDDQLAYAAKDASILLPLVDKLVADLHEAGLERAAAIEMRALPAITWLAISGAPFHQDRWLTLADAAVAEQLRLEEQLTTASGTADMFGGSSVNWGSPDQVAKLLRQRGHRIERTDEHTLQALAEQEPLAALLLEYREASRKASAYGVEFIRHVHPATGRVHADYQQIGASSGRMACGNPNLQNIPRDPAYRACFCPAPGRALVKADYSQIELRIAAQMTQDPVLLAAYRDGADVHLRTAAAVMNVEEVAVTRQQRQLAKALNFGLLYGMGAPRLQDYAASTYGVTLSEQEAGTFRAKWFQTYPGLRRWHRAQADGPVDTRTLAGRRRLGVERFVDKLNLPVQGTGADILKLALARLWEDRTAHPSAVPILCVHDEVVLECDAAEAQAVAGWLKDHMEAAGAELLPDVPVVADVTIAADGSGATLEFDSQEVTS